MNECRVIKAYSYTEWGDYKIMWRPDLMVGFYNTELKLSDEPKFLYEVTIPFPDYVDASFRGAWQTTSMITDRIEFVKAEPLGGGAWAVYIKCDFRECEEMPDFRIVLFEDIDGVVFKKIQIKTKPE